MTDQEINVAIAKECGWTVINDTLCDPRAVVKNGVQTGEVDMNPVASLPDYCNDLNAMHDAENTLNMDYPSTELAITFYGYLVKSVRSNILCVHATARQRAEAFLRTIGKWMYA